jgi:hypothetical protein
MTYRGKIVGGVVVLDQEASLPDGTEVTIQPIEKSSAAEPSTLGQRLMQFAGKAKGLPDDASRNHDHYLYGTPKR